MITTKRIYEPAHPDDGYRVLVDGLWPRGVSRMAARVDLWMKEIAPSGALRRWFGHAAERWPEFRRRYLEELSAPAARELLDNLRERARGGRVTLLYAARDHTGHNARVLEQALAEARSPQ